MDGFVNRFGSSPFYCRGVSPALAAALRSTTLSRDLKRGKWFVFTDHSSLRNERRRIKYQVFDSRALAYSRRRRIIDLRLEWKIIK